MPKDLEETYTEALKRIDKDQQEEANHILQWLLYAYEPLNIEQVADIIAVDLQTQVFDEENRPLDLAKTFHGILDSTLIIINAQGTSWRKQEIVQFAHVSVKEFLVSAHSQAGLPALWQFDAQLGHDTIAQTCIIYLLQFDDAQLLEEEGKSFALCQYAAVNWAKHRRELLNVGETLKSLGQGMFQENSLCYQKWVGIYENHELLRGRTRILQPIYYMSQMGLVEIVQNYLVTTASQEWQNGKYGDFVNALQVAAGNGFKEIVECLLIAGANPHSRGKYYRNALNAAAQGGGTKR